MNVLLIIDHIATGGAERILIDYYHYLEKNRHKIYVFVLSGHEGQSDWTKGLNVVYGTNSDEDNLIKKSIQQAHLFFELKRFVKSIQPDVIFSFLEKSNLLNSLIKTTAVKVMSVHNVLSIQYTKIKSNTVKKILYGIIKKMYNNCSNVIAVSKQVKDDLKTTFGVKEQNIHVINNYVDRAEIMKLSEEAINNYKFLEGTKYIMNVGRFSDQKAQWKLLKAFALFLKNTKENVCLILMGQGKYSCKLKELAVNLGISDKTFFLPFNVNPYKYMAHANLFVLSSIFEGFPIVLAEISSLRIPFVGSRKSIPEEMFDDKKIWESIIFENTTLNADFSNTIYEDEKVLAKLLKKGIEDNTFKTQILEHTIRWEKYNDKSSQFALYDKICGIY